MENDSYRDYKRGLRSPILRFTPPTRSQETTAPEVQAAPVLRQAVLRTPIHKFVYVDEWVPEEEDKIFKQFNKGILLPVSRYFKSEQDNALDAFILNSKRGYNSDEMRDHLTHYMNYFEKFYDQEGELLIILSHLKYLIDYEEDYTEDALIYDLTKYIFSGSILYKVRDMNKDNYTLELSYKNKKNPGIQYTKKHASILMETSLLQNIVIPLLTHFLYVNKIKGEEIEEFLLKVFDIILDLRGEDTDLYNKLFETANSNVNRNKKDHSTLWKMQSIRGKSPNTHSISTVNNIIMQIIPKYTYNRNIICFNYDSILTDIKYKVVDISYEYSFIALSSSKRDEDNNSEFDKFESHLTKQDESLYLQNKVNCEETMKLITLMFGPFDQGEIDFYIKELSRDGKQVINSFQKDLIFNLFFKYFGDPMSIKAINKEDYIKLMIAGRRILEANNLVTLPYILSSRVNKLQARKSVNKKELLKLEKSKYYPMIHEKYNSGKMEKQILGIIAKILSSEFQIIDYYDPIPHGKIVPSIPEFICEEVLMYINLI